MEFVYKSDIDVNLVQHMGDDAMIAAAAWASTSGAEALRKAEESQGSIPGVIGYLMKHRHGTPFEHGAMTIAVRAPIFVWREWHRHRMASYNEESARYKTLDPVFYIPPRDRPMMKVEDWKPGRPKFLRCESDTVYDALVHSLKGSYEQSYRAYQANQALNIDPGLTRDCLPVGIYSSCWVTFNPRSIMHFLSLRTHEPEARDVSYPLWEIDHAARKVEKIFANLWPLAYQSFVARGRVAP